MVGMLQYMAALFSTNFRRLIAEYQEQKVSEIFKGPVEINESYFAGKLKGIGVIGAAKENPRFLQFFA